MRCLVKARPAFADVPLSSLAIPGAENAGTFNLDPQAFDTQPGSACTTLSAGYGAGGAKAQRFSTTQDQTVTTQLDDGVRWIDLHVGYNGGGNAVTGWRVVQNLYSSWPLSEYLDQVANWAAKHPTEAVVVDLSTICYDHNPTAAIDQGLWANFATKSAEGAGPKTIADVAARPSSFGGSLASATLRDLARRGHNVVVLIPAFAVGWQALPGTYHVNPVRTTVPGRGGSGTTTVMRSDPKVAPTSPTPVSAGQRRTRRLPDQVQAAARVTPRSGPVRQQIGLRARGRLRRGAEDDPLLVRRPHRLPRGLPRLDVRAVERGLRADPRSVGSRNQRRPGRRHRPRRVRCASDRTERALGPPPDRGDLSRRRAATGPTVASQILDNPRFFDATSDSAGPRRQKKSAGAGWKCNANRRYHSERYWASKAAG